MEEGSWIRMFRVVNSQQISDEQILCVIWPGIGRCHGGSIKIVKKKLSLLNSQNWRYLSLKSWWKEPLLKELQLKAPRKIILTPPSEPCFLGHCSECCEQSEDDTALYNSYIGVWWLILFNGLKINLFQAFTFPQESHEEPSHSKSSPLNAQASNPRASNPRERCSIGNFIITPEEAKLKAQKLVKEIRVLEQLKKKLEEELECMLNISSQEIWEE